MDLSTVSVQLVGQAPTPAGVASQLLANIAFPGSKPAQRRCLLFRGTMVARRSDR